MKHIYLLFCLFFWSTIITFGSNLVLNPGFEIRSNSNYCPIGPWGAGTPFPSNWGVLASPDYFHTCATHEDYNPNLKAQPVRAGGQAYAGFIAHWEGNNAYSEFLIQNLTSTLSAGKSYYIEFWVSLKDNSSYSVKTLGIYLAPKGATLPSSSLSMQQLGAELKSNVFYDNKTGWTKISGYVTPTAPIDRIVIGNFDPNAASKSSLNKRPEASGCNDITLPDACGSVAYYYVDDVIIREECPVPTTPYYSIQVFQSNNGRFCVNSFGNTFSIEPQTFAPGITFEWGYTKVNGGGTQVVNSNGGLYQDFIFYEEGLYEIYARAKNACGYSTTDMATRYVTAEWCTGGGGGFPEDPLGVTSTLSLTVYPNPTSDKLMIDSGTRSSSEASGLDVKLFDSQGKLRKHGRTKEGKLELTLSDLPEGIYYLHASNGKKTEKKQIVIER